jgi:iron complex transport system ATP-binding protein
MVDPELILLDEPTSGLDLPGREDLLTRFAAFSSDPSSPASIIVTHHLEEIPVGTTHALLIKNGQIAYSGEINDVLTTTNVSEVFNYSLNVSKEGSRFFARANR